MPINETGKFPLSVNTDSLMSQSCSAQDPDLPLQSWQDQNPSKPHLVMTARRWRREFLGLLLHPCKGVTTRCVWGRGLCFPKLTRPAPAHHTAARLRFPHTPPHKLKSPRSNLKQGSGSPVSPWIPWAGSWECESESPSAGQSLLKHPLIYCSKTSGDPGDLTPSLLSATKAVLPVTSWGKRKGSSQNTEDWSGCCMTEVGN